MKELLDKIQTLIENCIQLDVEIQQEQLEPFFNEAYDYCRNNDVDMRELLKLSQLENQLTKKIISVTPIIEPSNNANENDRVIEQIIYYSRKKMESLYGCSIANDSLKARSLDFCNIIMEMSKNLGVSAVKFNLMDYFDIPFKHYVVIACLNKKYYLLDLTYQQYFILGNNFRNRYYEHPTYTRVCDIGRRIIDKDRKCAENIVKYGYVEDEDLIKHYFDAFMELANIDELNHGYDYLRIMINSLKGSNEKNEKYIYNTMSREG